MLSIIITTIKNEVLTVQSLSCPFPYEIILSKKAGLGYARNHGARLAKSNLLIFFDDDLIIKKEFWRNIPNVKPKEFAMTFLSGFPCSRVLIIHQEDFWKIGGFDENIKVTGEDRDFYVRALDSGLKFKTVSSSLITHKNHASRMKNIHVAIRGVYENTVFLTKYAGRYPAVFKVDFLQRLIKGQLRTLLLEFVFLASILMDKMRGEECLEK